MVMNTKKYTEVDATEIALIALELGQSMKEFDRFGYYSNMNLLLRKMKTYHSIFDSILVRCEKEHPNFAKYGYKIPV